MGRKATGAPKRNIWKDPSPYGTYEGEAGSPEQWRSAFQFAWDGETAKEVIKDESPWTILCIPANSDLAIIKKAFHKLMLANHPDKGGNKEICQKIISAYVLVKEGLE